MLLMSWSCIQDKPRETGVFNTPGAETDVAVGLDLNDIQSNGELIILTLYGAQSYFEFYGEGFGTLYKLAEQYARSIGCAVRVDVLHDEAELKRHLANGDGDIVTYNIAVNDSLSREFLFCGERELTRFISSKQPVAWLVRKDAPMLAKSVNDWMVRNHRDFKAMTAIKVTDDRGRVYTPRRRAYSPMINRGKGEISQYDHLFKKYSTQCRWDWKLLAAQAYQESGFDAEAVSYMGALGLMQLMPRTAQSMGVSISQAFEPENNLRGAVRYISHLDRHYSSISNSRERIKFILAAYNAGEGHIDDARNLARKLGHNPDLWDGHVDQCVLHLSQPSYFNDPIVRHGYMRGSETFKYVSDIMVRWNDYIRMAPAK